MQDISDRIKQIAKEAEPELISIRRELHQYPELGINLPKRVKKDSKPEGS